MIVIDKYISSVQRNKPNNSKRNQMIYLIIVIFKPI